jgi:di/tricarboxylate transporter
MTTQRAAASIEYQLVAGIAAAFALGVALTQSGAAALAGTWLVEFARGNPWLALTLLYVLTVVVTEMITNNAAGVLMFPIAMSVAHAAGVNYMPYVIAVMIGASAGFITPIGYQTNLMVYGPGGYRFSDFVRFGLPLNILCGIITIAIVPRVWVF